MLYTIKKPPFLVKQGFTGQKYFRFPITPEANAEIQIELKISTGSGTSTYLVNYNEDAHNTVVSDVILYSCLFNNIPMGVVNNGDHVILAIGGVGHTWQMSTIFVTATGKTDGVYIGNPVELEHTSYVDVILPRYNVSTSDVTGAVVDYLMGKSIIPSQNTSSGSIDASDIRSVVALTGKDWLDTDFTLNRTVTVRNDNTIEDSAGNTYFYKKHPGFNVKVVDMFYSYQQLIVLFDNGDLYAGGFVVSSVFFGESLHHCMHFVTGGIKALHYNEYFEGGVNRSAGFLAVAEDYNNKLYTVGACSLVINSFDGTGVTPTITTGDPLLKPITEPEPGTTRTFIKVVEIKNTLMLILSYSTLKNYYISNSQIVELHNGSEPKNVPVQFGQQYTDAGEAIVDFGISNVYTGTQVDPDLATRRVWTGYVQVSSGSIYRISSHVDGGELLYDNGDGSRKVTVYPTVWDHAANYMTTRPAWIVEGIRTIFNYGEKGDITNLPFEPKSIATNGVFSTFCPEAVIDSNDDLWVSEISGENATWIRHSFGSPVIKAVGTPSLYTPNKTSLRKLSVLTAEGTYCRMGVPVAAKTKANYERQQTPGANEFRRYL